MIRQVAYIPTPSQWTSATIHLERRVEWIAVRVKGIRYILLPSGCSGHHYYVRADAAGCQCRWYEQTGTQCSHMLAVELAATLDELQADAALPRVAYGALFPAECAERSCTKDAARTGERFCRDHWLDDGVF